MRRNAGISLADVAMVLALILLAVAIIYPRQFFRQKAENERNAISGLRSVKKAQDTFSAGLDPIDYASKLAGLGSYNFEATHDSIFDVGTYSGYTFNLVTKRADRVPRWSVDMNIVLSRIADRNEVLAIAANGDWTAVDALEHIVSRRQRLAASDPNVSFTQTVPTPPAELGDGNWVLQPIQVNSLDLTGMPFVPAPMPADFRAAMADLNAATAEADQNAALVADMNAVLPLTPRRAFATDLSFLANNPSPLREYLDSNLVLLGETTWSASAWPLTYDVEGVRSFYIDTTGVVRGEDIGGGPGSFAMSKIE